MGHKTVSFFSKRQICPIYKSEIPDLVCVCFLVRLRVQFVRYVGPKSYISYKYLEIIA